MKRIRCAIYTRKSSEEGLEQDFNSLHAQREACAAYVLSQASEGWTLNPEDYDDGGISGGTLERPALQRLLADIAAGSIDIVVVYKVDRLTRSLLDFSKLVEVFDKAAVSFVSITQSFNTTTSMGRLTLNMLLSFAQFEREVTAERIRDKIAASKAKGMWMGGTPPLGYAKDERTLKIVADEAVFVRRLFERYLELGNVRSLAEDLADDGIVSPVRTYGSGRQGGGGTMTRGQLYYLLNNPIYIGRIRHRDKTYPGQHPLIVEADTWDAVQALLAENTQGHQRRGRSARVSLLAGLVEGERGEPLIATHASKPARSGTGGGMVRYRYYVTPSAVDGPRSQGTIMRIPARELEKAVISQIAEALRDPLDLAIRTGAPLDSLRTGALEDSATSLIARLQASDPATIQTLIAAVKVLPDAVEIELDTAALATALGLRAPTCSDPITLISNAKLSRTGMAVRLVFADGKGACGPEVKPSLVKLLVKARTWWAHMATGAADRETLAQQAGVIPSYVSRVVRLAFLSPAVVEAILSGRHPADLDGGKLLAPGFPASWKEQERLFLGVGPTPQEGERLSA